MGVEQSWTCLTNFAFGSYVRGKLFLISLLSAIFCPSLNYVFCAKVFLFCGFIFPYICKSNVHHFDGNKSFGLDYEIQV